MPNYFVKFFYVFVNLEIFFSFIGVSLCQGHRQLFQSLSWSPPQAVWQNFPTLLLPSSSISSVNQQHLDGAGSCQEDKTIMFPSGYSLPVMYIYLEEMLSEEMDLLQTVFLPDHQEQTATECTRNVQQCPQHPEDQQCLFPIVFFCASPWRPTQPCKHLDRALSPSRGTSSFLSPPS